MKFNIGIDWSTQRHDVCILGEDEKIIKSFPIDIDADGFAVLLQQLVELTEDKSQIRIGIETDKNLLVDFLLSCGYTVYSINPRKVKRFKERYLMSSSKNDRFDAFCIAHFLLKDGHLFAPIKSSSSACVELRGHCETLEMFIKDRTRLLNRLRETLLQFFPAFSGFFRDMSAGVALHSLLAIQSPSKLKGMNLEGFLELLKDVKRLGPKRKEKLYEYLKRNMIHFDSLSEKSLIDRTSLLVRNILRVNEFMSETETLIKNVYENHELSKTFSSLPMAGKRLAPRMLSLLGDNMDRFDTIQKLQCYAGTAPVTEQSGKSFYSIKMRRACNKELRNVLQLYAFCTISSEPWAREYYHQLRKKGKSHSVAVRALANKWAKIIFRLWKNKDTYNAEIFLKKRDKFRATAG